MLNITIFGTSNSSRDLVEQQLDSYLHRAKIDHEIIIEDNLNKMLQLNISSIPAIQVDDDPIIYIKDNSSYSKSLRMALTNVLSKENFGDMPQVLVPIDFSDASVNALIFGQRLATDLNFVTKVQHVYKPELSHIDDDVESTHRQKLDELVDKIDTDWESDIVKASLIDKAFSVGFPVEEIQSLAEEVKTPLIVMATTGEGNHGLKKLMGSVSIDITQKSKCPVLLVPQTAKYSGASNVVFALDNVEEEIESIKHLIALLKPFETNIDFVHIVKGSEFKDEDHIKQRIGEILPTDRFNVHFVKGNDVVDTLMGYTAQQQPDMIVLSRKKRGFVENLFHKSVSMKISYLSEVPVLILQ